MGQDEIFINGVKYHRIGKPFLSMAEAERSAKLLREKGCQAERRGYCVYVAADKGMAVLQSSGK